MSKRKKKKKYSENKNYFRCIEKFEFEIVEFKKEK